MKKNSNSNLLIPALAVVALLAIVLGLKFLFFNTSNIEVNQNVPNVGVELVPATDVPGEEPQDLPRFTGCTRASFETSNGEVSTVTIIYRCWGDKADEALNFYRAEMENGGWKFEGQSTENVGQQISYGPYTVKVEKSYALHFSKPDENKAADIYIDAGSVNGKIVTQIEVVYEKTTEEVPFKPLNQEPAVKEVKVPAGLVLYQSEETALGGIKSITDKYYGEATKVSVQELFNYFKTNVPQGYSLMGAELTGDTASITYILTSTGSPQIYITIEPAAESDRYIVVSVSKIESGGQ